MDIQNNRVTLYCSQTKEIVNRIRNGNVHQAKVKFIREKYGDVSHVFMIAYDWYASNASRIAPKPNGAESGIWAFSDIKFIDVDECCSIMELSVPSDQVIFFRMSDWNKILNLRYLGSDDSDSQRFEEKLTKHGIKDETDVLMKPFYPQLKTEMIRSWDRLFQYNEAHKHSVPEFPDMQAGLWEIRPEWVANWDC